MLLFVIFDRNVDAGTAVSGTPLETKTYTYGDGEWKDLLTSYNGNTITYDAIGNRIY